MGTAKPSVPEGLTLEAALPREVAGGGKAMRRETPAGMEGVDLEAFSQLSLAGGEDFLVEGITVRIHCDHGRELLDFEFPNCFRGPELFHQIYIPYRLDTLG